MQRALPARLSGASDLEPSNAARMPEPGPPLVLIVGGDSLALQVCEELTEFEGQDVAILWPLADETFAARVARCGARFVSGKPNDEDALVRAGVCAAVSIMLLTDDDHLNLETSLRARDLNPSIRIVMRQFNRTLGAKIEAKLPNCSVISLAAQSAATYATVAVDRACFYGVQFPDFVGPLFGFAERGVARLGLAGATVAEAEARLGLRVLAIDGELDADGSARLRGGSTVVTFGPVRAESGPAKHSGLTRSEDGSLPARHVRRFARALARTEPLVGRTVLAGLAVFALASLTFGYRLGLAPIAAMYFVTATMTTTGYGDIVPAAGDRLAQAAAIVTMIGGTIFTAIFVAILTSRFTQAQFRMQQGLRKITRRGHVVVCGAGNVGTRVVDFLRALDRHVVVIEAKPRSAIVERSRDREFELLTGDATADSTLALCNLEEADALIALTESDTMNLEVALGAGQINSRLPVVLRVQEHAFARSIAHHFGMTRSYGTVGLAAPVFAGLSRSPGVRGFVTIGGREFAVAESSAESSAEAAEPGRVPLAVWRESGAVLIRTLDDVRTDDRALVLSPAYRYRKSSASTAIRSRESHAGLRSQARSRRVDAATGARGEPPSPA